MIHSHVSKKIQNQKKISLSEGEMLGQGTINHAWEFVEDWYFSNCSISKQNELDQVHSQKKC